MKNILLTAILFFTVCSFAKSNDLKLKSPDGRLQINITLVNSSLVYEVEMGGKPVIQTSKMGLNGDVDFSNGLKIISISKAKLKTETYLAPAEKRTERKYTVNCASILLQNSAKNKMIVEFKATNEGVAFRYIIKAKSPFAIKSENTTFKLIPSTIVWMHPHANVKEGWCETQPSYEEQYEYEIPVGTIAPEKAGWSFPALFKTDHHFVLITEAGLTPDYVGTRLAQQSPNGEYSIGFPQKGETTQPDDPEYVVSKNVISPWRVIIVGSLATVVESQMVSDLAKPADKKTDFSWVKTGIASWSWGVLHDESVNYETSKQFIDYASDMKWDYCLIDADWDRKIGYDKIKELADYAKTKNVGLILWYNSSGDWNTTVYSPKGALIEREARRKEFERIHSMGIAGVKVDFWPGDGQSAIQYYYDMMQDAADFHLLLNCHGTTVPRGWSRTFPNLVSMESIRGFEFTTFEQKDTDKAPKHLTMMPYARNVVGPMDFTPVCFGEIVGKKRRTSNAFELALTVILQSGIQHYVEIPESMALQPDFVKDYMRSVPRRWDDIKFIDGYPGKYVVLARRCGDKWYLAGINSQPEMLRLNLNLTPLKLAANEKVTLFTDGENNRSFKKIDVNITNDRLELELKPNGGFVVVL